MRRVAITLWNRTFTALVSWFWRLPLGKGVASTIYLIWWVRLSSVISTLLNTINQIIHTPCPWAEQVWDHWDNGTVMDIILGSSSLSSSSGEMLRRCVQIGLLCVQDSPADRPTMSAVNVMMLNNSNTLPQPSRARPPVINTPGPAGASTGTRSQNDVSITELEPR